MLYIKQHIAFIVVRSQNRNNALGDAKSMIIEQNVIQFACDLIVNHGPCAHKEILFLFYTKFHSGGKLTI